MANLRRAGPALGTGDADIWPERFNTCFTPLAALVLLFLMLCQRETRKEQRAQAWVQIQEYVTFACRAATTAEEALLSVPLQIGEASYALSFMLGPAGEIVGLENLLRLFPAMQTYWESQVGRPWSRDSTGKIRLANTPAAAYCADVILLLAMVAPAFESAATPFWQEVCVPIAKALFGQLALLLQKQAWRRLRGG